MEYRINNKKIRLNTYNMKYSKKLGSGSTADVYLIGDCAYKLYKPYSSIKEPMNKEKVEKLKNIKTKRIVLPKESILSKKRNFCGYISKYVKNLGYEDILNMSKKDLINELKILRDDFILLGDNKILIRDMNIENTSFNNGIYPIDCGRYLTENETNYDENITISSNLDEYFEYVLYEIIGTYFKRKKQYQEIKNIRNDINKNYDSIIEYITENMQEENLNQYLKRKVM